MSEELPTNISPERMAEIRSAVESAHQAMRQALALGTSPDLLKEALVKGMGLSEEQVEAIIKEHRDQLKREASVDRDLEVANMLTCLTLLYNLAMQEGDYKTALNVLRERAHFTGATQFVKYSSGESNRLPSEFEKALDEIGGMERERHRQEIVAQARKMREKDVAEKERVKNP